MKHTNTLRMLERHYGIDGEMLEHAEYALNSGRMLVLVVDEDYQAIGLRDCPKVHPHHLIFFCTKRMFDRLNEGNAEHLLTLWMLCYDAERHIATDSCAVLPFQIRRL